MLKQRKKRELKTKDKCIKLSGKELEDLFSSIRNKEEELLQLDECKEHLKKLLHQLLSCEERAA